MRYVALAVALFALGVALTRIDLEPQAFTPVVRLRTDSGLFITMIQDRTTKPGPCREAIERVVAPLREACRGCTVESTGCLTELNGVDRALASGERLPLYTVRGEGLRMAVLGPPNTVRASCELLATQMVLTGMKSASCVFPDAPMSGR